MVGIRPSSSLSTNPDGVLSGTVTVPGGVTGAVDVTITAGSESSAQDLTILGDRSITVEPGQGELPVKVKVTGADFDPTADVTVVGYRGDPGDAGTETTDEATGTVELTDLCPWT